MKTKLKLLGVFGFTFGVILQLHAQGYLVPNGITNLGFNGLGYEFHVIQNPTDLNYTGFSLDPSGKTPPTVYTNTFLFNPFLDEGVRTFLVSSNDPISLQPISANSYTELTFPNSYVFKSGTPFYLGFYTGPRWTQFPPTDPITYDDPLFGWARLVNNQGAIQLLDSALGFGAQGIYAGTQNFAPEPSASALVVLGASSLFLFRRKKNCFTSGSTH